MIWNGNSFTYQKIRLIKYKKSQIQNIAGFSEKSEHTGKKLENSNL